MLLAGYETTANTLVTLVYSIAVEKDVQEKLYQELVKTETKFVSKQVHLVQYHCSAKLNLFFKGGLSYEAINSMKYLDMCMKESQRLYGAVPK